MFFKNNKTGAPDGAYLNAVRKRFGQWILDTADANYDQAWLDYQYEIGLRHTSPKKNKTDKADSVPSVNFRYPVTGRAASSNLPKLQDGVTQVGPGATLRHAKKTSDASFQDGLVQQGSEEGAHR